MKKNEHFDLYVSPIWTIKREELNQILQYVVIWIYYPQLMEYLTIIHIENLQCEYINEVCTCQIRICFVMSNTYMFRYNKTLIKIGRRVDEPFYKYLF